MPKRTIALMIIIGIITILLIVAAFAQLRKGTSTPPDPTENSAPGTTTSQPANKQASLSFNPSQILNASLTPTIVEVMADTGGLGITGIQIELEYDPAQIANVSFVPVTANSLFGESGQVLIEEIRPEAGRISYAVVINPSAPEVKGIGSVIGISFTAAQGATGQTQIRFLDKSLVTMFGTTESVLKGTTPLSVTFSSSSSPSGQFQQPQFPTSTPLPAQ